MVKRANKDNSPELRVTKPAGKPGRLQGFPSTCLGPKSNCLQVLTQDTQPQAFQLGKQRTGSGGLPSAFLFYIHTGWGGGGHTHVQAPMHVQDQAHAHTQAHTPLHTDGANKSKGSAAALRSLGVDREVPVYLGNIFATSESSNWLADFLWFKLALFVWKSCLTSTWPA